MQVKGRDLVEGVPKTITITDEEIREALAEPVSTIVDAVLDTLERTPPELAADIVDRGIVLAGGGALLEGLDRRISEATGLPVSVAEDPLTSVVVGTGRMLGDFDLNRRSGPAIWIRCLVDRTLEDPALPGDRAPRAGTPAGRGAVLGRQAPSARAGTRPRGPGPRRARSRPGRCARCTCQAVTS